MKPVGHRPRAAASPAAADGWRQVGVATPAFRRLWWAWAVSLLGDGVRSLALPLYVAIQTGSPLAASAVTAAEVLPWLLFALPAGAVVDRVSAKLVVLVAHVARAILTAALVVAIVTGNAGVASLCVFAFLLTLGETFAYPASQVLLVQFAGPDELTEANAKFYLVHTVGLNLAGPLAAGGIFVLGPELAFAVDGLTFIVAATLVAGLPRGASASLRSRSWRTLRHDVWQGLSFLVRMPGLRVLVLMVLGATIAASAANALTPLYALQRLGMPPGLVSFLFVIGALGTLLATWAVPRLVRRWSEGPIMILSMVVMSLGMILFGAVPLIATALIANGLIGIGVGAWNVLAAARRQRLTPESAMGRVSGAYRMVAWGLMPVGAGLAGPLAVTTSLGAVFVIVGLLVLVTLLVVARPLLRTGAVVPGRGERQPE